MVLNKVPSLMEGSFQSQLHHQAIVSGFSPNLDMPESTIGYTIPQIVDVAEKETLIDKVQEP